MARLAGVSIEMGVIGTGTKVALVTGGSSGIGAAACMALHRRGYSVYAVARRVERMAALAAEGINVRCLDVTDDASMVSGIEAIIAERGRLDLLVNNAGYGSYGALEDVPLEEARRQIEVNVLGLARLTQLALPQMRSQGSGRIINISSVFGRMSAPLGAWYHASKYAVEGLSGALRQEVRPFGIDVVIIEPGAIKTEWSQIAVDKALEVSGETAYGPQARAVAGAFGKLMERTGAAPQVIADAIVRAATVRRPRARYVAPASIGFAVVLTRFVPDRMLDWVMQAMFGPSRAGKSKAR